MTARSISTDPDTGIPDLIRRLTHDSKRLVADEVRIAKIETRDSLHRATRGILWLALAFGVSIVMLVALTLFLVTFIGWMTDGYMWVGAVVTGALELGIGAYLVRRGLSTLATPSYSLEQSRNALADTAHWAASVRQR